MACSKLHIFFVGVTLLLSIHYVIYFPCLFFIQKRERKRPTDRHIDMISVLREFTCLMIIEFISSKQNLTLLI